MAWHGGDACDGAAVRGLALLLSAGCDPAMGWGILRDEAVQGHVQI